MMMKVLVAFATKHGATAEVAEEIAQTIRGEGHDVDVADLGRGTMDDVDSYDLAVVGSGIIAGNWIKGARRFIEKRSGELRRVRTAFFIVGSEPYFEPERREELLAKYITGPVSEQGLTPSSTAVFGGVFDFSKYGRVVTAILTKMGVKKVLSDAGFDVSGPCDLRDWDRIRDWASSLV